MSSACLRVALVVAGIAAVAPGAALAQGSGALPAKAYGPEFSIPSPGPEAASGGGVTEYDLSLGCIVGGVAGTGLSVTAGGMNVVNLIAGGLVPATSPVAMWVALGGVVFASFCSVGQALTPTAMASYAYFVPPQQSFGGPALDAGYCKVAENLTPATPPPDGRMVPARLLRIPADPM